jgi:hypothetical protein
MISVISVISVPLMASPLRTPIPEPYPQLKSDPVLFSFPDLRGVAAKMRRYYS